MVRKISLILLLSAVLTLVTLISGSLAQQEQINLGLIDAHSLLNGFDYKKLPSLDDAEMLFSLKFAEKSNDANGLPLVQGALEMKPCCIPGSTGAEEHTLQLTLLGASYEGVHRLKGLQLSISGYCTIEDAASDIASTASKAADMLDMASSEEALENAALKALAVAHYHWYTGIEKGPRYFSIDVPGNLAFTLMVDPEKLDITLLWPAVLPGAKAMSVMLSEYDAISEGDKLGIQTVLKADFNALALEKLEAADATHSHTIETSTGTT